MKQITVLWGSNKQAVYLLDEPHVVIGRGRSAHVPLDGNPIVSRQHATIREDPPSHVLEDLGGPNGTFVNGQRITRIRLQNGDRVTLGKHSIRYEDATPEAKSLKRAPATGMSAEDVAATAQMDPIDPMKAMENELAGRMSGSAAPAGMTTGTRAGAGPAAPGGSEPPWSAQPNRAARPSSGTFAGSQQTMAASREELEVLLAQMTIKSGPHLSVSINGKMELVPLDGSIVRIGHLDDCKVRLPGNRLFGKVAGEVAKRGDKYIVIAASPFWRPLHVGSSKVRKKRKLNNGQVISVGEVKIRFSLGEQS